MPPETPDKRLLLAVAAPAEAKAVLRGLGGDPALAERPWRLHPVTPGIDLVVTGIGKSNAAGAVARCLDPSRHGAVISLGVAGALPQPGGGGPPIGAAVVADACIFADEGLESGEGPAGWRDCAAMGFPLGPPPVKGSRVAVPADLVGRLSAAVLREGERDAGVMGEWGGTGGVATVSTCSGTDALAARVRERTGAVAEAMEGAAVALVAARLGVAAGEVRVISNTTGDRSRQVWDLASGLRRLEHAAAGLSAG